eukprot:TRINITY_DN2222_c0_g1_i1.p1 TRINITY_DN2222_c0_g1~~TRINITY_DN2222_c0_g1_i1.p1  ORF type:complete len:269 (-),score=61.26 TRINITY_DN2222_c0_g1_i1:350-1156(-)
MYVDEKHHPTASMENISLAAINQTLLGQFGAIPKRVPIDNIQWMQSSTLGRPYLTPDELAKIYGEKDYSFYLVLTLLTLGFVCGILCLYICFCAWAMKGNMDLPLPGGGFRKTSVLKFVNPFKELSIANMLRYRINNNNPPQHQSHNNNSNTMNPDRIGGPAVGDGGVGHIQQQIQQHLSNHQQFTPEEPRIPTISHNQQHQFPQSTASCDREGDRGGSNGNSSKLFESKALGLHDSFKQFRQFRYDHQMDDEPEQVIFDVYDIKHDQ